ncbi:MAG: class I SAM-dependent methyltransferase, partial [Deltaproteobacteria bacterium]|nr:class I SAM-dependent methyltransferase [Deltaproteobacteria bacterium]
MNPQVEPSHYFRKEYDSKKRWISYWHQIDEILTLSLNSVLEVGIGNGLVANYLKRRGINITTLDIDERLMPDYVGSVLDMPFADNSFEVVTCY